MGNRVFFEENGVVVLHGSLDAVVPTHADFCRPLHDRGAIVEAVRVRLAARVEPGIAGSSLFFERYANARETA